MSSPRKQAAAVVGTGFIGPVHIEALLRIGVCVRGVLGSTPEKGTAVATQFDLGKVYREYSELLADSSISVVHITTPNRCHRQMALDALAAGKHVICEKPLAMNSVESRDLVAAAHRSAQVAAVNYNVRFYPVMLHARELIQAGELGEILSVRGAYVQDWLLYPTDWNWRLLPEEGGKLRAVGDIGTHWLDLVLFLTGLSIDAVFADLATLIPVRQRPRQTAETFKRKENGTTSCDEVTVTTEDWGSVLLRFAGGARGNLSVSQTTAGRKNQISLEIAGSQSALAWDSEHPNDLWIGYRNQPNQLLVRDPALLRGKARDFSSYPGGHNEGFPDTFKQLYHAFYEFIEDRSQPKLFATFEDGHRELVLCEAILASNQQGSWVYLAEPI
ncbi:MAG: Gfo/Idh/MocA family oxidoreductase [Verrucomicrobia bacterium]|nr:Gfo/Idh/MocA family oxidoreductase [Verrucomicrobiota bacterium]